MLKAGSSQYLLNNRCFGGLMKKNMLILSSFILLSVYLISCSYLSSSTAVNVLPEYIKKVYVKSLNITKSFGIEIEFTKAIEKEIIMDGRLSLVDTEEEADVVFIAKIKKYILQPFTYDKNKRVSQYKLYIEASISLVDKNKNIILEELNMERMHIYRDYIPHPHDEIFYDKMSEKKARKIIFNMFSKYIIRQVVR
jgi:outer membrane lipopolysaccharide assembly protein LptE/RlpB